jgi:hypothetical protein
MRWSTSCTLALALAAAGPALARPPGPRPGEPEPNSESAKVEAAIKVWSKGDWTRVRGLLEPLVQGERTLGEPLLQETALRYLADATIQDGTLDANIRAELATGYVNRLLALPDWRPPEQTHSAAFYELYNRLREQRDQSRAKQCAAELTYCQAGLEETSARYTRLQSDHALLQNSYNQQEVEVQEKVARNRAVAIIPFGVGQFYNGRRGLGAAFLASEIVFGGVGLGLYIARLFDCSRENGFQRGSLTCQGEGKEIVARRNAEQAMGLFFLGTVALDILIAQVTFRPFLTVKTTRVRRQDLDNPPPDPRARPGMRGPAPPAPRSRAPARDILRVSPAPAYIPGGGGFGVSLKF